MNRRNLYKKYLHYEESDFMSDTLFQDIAFNPGPENELLRKEIESLFPEKKMAIQHALDFLRAIEFKDHQPEEGQADRAFAEHLSTLRTAGLLSEPEQEAPVSRPLWYRFRNVAAVLAGLLLLSGVSFVMLKRVGQGELQVKTSFGETQRLVLPDGSDVELNANSSVRYAKEWTRGRKREVWLEGEALFKVVHLNRDTSKLEQEEYFVVHTRGLNVTVLGTVFDVRQRREVTEVVLQKGKVKVSFEKDRLPDVILTPGKRVIYDGKAEKVEEDRVVTANYTAWKEKKLLLVNPTIRQISAYLEDNFGKKIVTSDEALNDKMIAGPIPLNSLNDALFVISTVSNVDILRPDSSTILLKRR